MSTCPELPHRKIATGFGLWHEAHGLVTNQVVRMYGKGSAFTSACLRSGPIPASEYERPVDDEVDGMRSCYLTTAVHLAYYPLPWKAIK